MKKNTKTILVLVVLLILSVLIRFYFCLQKEDFFMDETFSYTLMNSEYGMLHQIPDIENRWIKGNDIMEAVTLQESEILDYAQVYNNQVSDCHPFLYYFLLHTISIFRINQFTMWTGLFLNILIWIGSFCVLYLIGKKVLKNNFYAILLCVLYSFSKGAIGNTLLVRMYELFVFNTLVFIYFVLKLLENRRFRIVNELLLVIVTIVGFLTHYYFLFIIVPTYLVIFIKLLKDKRFKDSLCLLSCGVLSGIVSLIIYPSCIDHIFNNGRGIEAINNFINIGTYLSDIKSSVHLINENLFCGYIIPIAILIIIGIICFYVKCKKEKIKFHIDFSFTLLCVITIFYFFIVCKIAPYKAERYYVAIFPIIYIVFVMVVKILLDKFINKQKIVYVILGGITIVFVVLNIISSNNIWYLYKGTNQIYEAIYESNCENLIYLYKDYCYNINNDITRFMNFNNIYISNIDNEEWIKNLDKEKVILYLPLEETDYINYFMNNSKFSKYQYIAESWYGQFYLIEK